MPQENVELVRAALERWNRGERDMADYHPEVEWLPLRAATEGAYRGIDGMERFLADTEQTFEQFQIRCDLLAVGERVLAWGTIHVRAAQSGIEMDVPVGGVVECRGGKIVRFEDFGSKQAALEALGLAE